MLRFLSLVGLAVTIATSIAGCASAPGAGVSNIDYAGQRYEASHFDKPGIAKPIQLASFRSDIDACEALAQQRYNEALASSAKLASIYGQAITPQTLLRMKHMQVQGCMSGDQGASETGKGWVAR